MTDNYNPPFFICIIPNLLTIPFTLIIIFVAVFLYWRLLKEHRKKRKQSKKDHRSDYQFAAHSKQIVENYNRYKLKRSQSLHNELLNGINPNRDNITLLNQMDVDLFSFIAGNDSNDANDDSDVNKAICLANKALLSANYVIPKQLAHCALNQVLEPNELVLWADCPYFKARKEKTVKTAVALYGTSLAFNLTFAMIGGFLGEHPLDALATSFMGIITAFLFFLVGIYFTISLKTLNFLYIITNKRIIICKRKGFFREKTVTEIIPYDNLPGIIQVTKYTNEKDEFAYGDIHFQKNYDVLNVIANRQWKMDDTDRSTLKGFKCIFHIETVEKLLDALIEIKKSTIPPKSVIVEGGNSKETKEAKEVKN